MAIAEPERHYSLSSIAAAPLFLRERRELSWSHPYKACNAPAVCRRAVFAGWNPPFARFDRSATASEAFGFCASCCSDSQRVGTFNQNPVNHGPPVSPLLSLTGSGVRLP